MPLAAIWVDLEIIILSEASQKKINTVWYHLYVKSKNDTNEHIYKTEIDSQIQRRDLEMPRWGGGGEGEGRTESLRLLDTSYYI